MPYLNRRKGGTPHSQMGYKKLLCGAVLLSGVCVHCARRPEPQPPARQVMSKNDINEVLKAHSKELMALPGVVGVYVGMLDDGKTLCLKVMVEKKTPDLVRRLPDHLEGYPLVVEETGPIRPMRKQ